MKLSELKNIIMECVEELSEGPARKKRQEVGYQYKDGLDDPLKTPIKYRQEFNMSVKPSKSQYTRKKASKVNPRSVDKDYYPRKIRGSFKKLGEEKKYHTEPPKTGFNRTEPMAYKKKSLSGKIMGGIRKIEKKMRVESSD